MKYAKVETARAQVRAYTAASFAQAVAAKDGGRDPRAEWLQSMNALAGWE